VAPFPFYWNVIAAALHPGPIFRVGSRCLPVQASH